VVPEQAGVHMGSTFQCWAEGNRASLNIGGILLEVCGLGSDELRLQRDLGLFRAENARPHIQITIQWAGSLDSCASEIIFDSGAVWRLFHEGATRKFDFHSPVFGPGPYKRLRMDSDFRNGELLLTSQLRGEENSCCPLEYPADELLITNYLAHHALGIEVHGCGVVDAETGGHLFLGHSGTGKSTTARIWETFRKPEILSDDRIILRLHQGELWMYGTPWHGEAAFASPGKAKLNRIHILRHGSQNTFTVLPQARAVGEVFARSFPPFHSEAGLEHTLDFIKRALDAAQCYEFEFLPDGSSVAAVLGVGSHD
jgi:hypothetical protein